ncbi:MAG: hypothetical protein ABWY12_03390 [Burkholderiales bacterium]
MQTPVGRPSPHPVNFAVGASPLLVSPASGSGRSARSTRDGAIALASMGTFTVVGGTGAFEGITGSGHQVGGVYHGEMTL